jgi:micrococcal nuclease
MASAEREAERNRAGIWGMREYQPKPVERLNRSEAVGWQRLVGTATALSDGRNYAGLRFGERLEVRIPKQNLRLFPALSSYLGQKLEARGWLSRQARKPAVWVRHPSALVRR